MKICDVKECGAPGNNYVAEPMMDLCEKHYQEYLKLVQTSLLRRPFS